MCLVEDLEWNAFFPQTRTSQSRSWTAKVLLFCLAVAKQNWFGLGKGSTCGQLHTHCSLISDHRSYLLTAGAWVRPQQLSCWNCPCLCLRLLSHALCCEAYSGCHLSLLQWGGDDVGSVGLALTFWALVPSWGAEPGTAEKTLGRAHGYQSWAEGEAQLFRVSQ